MPYNQLGTADSAMKRKRLVFGFIFAFLLLVVVIPIFSYYVYHSSAGVIDASFTSLGQEFVSEKATRSEVLNKFTNMGLIAKEAETSWGENSLVVEQSPKMLIPFPADPKVRLAVTFHGSKVISFSVYRVRFFF